MKSAFDLLMLSPTRQLPIDGNDHSWTFPIVSESTSDSPSLSHNSSPLQQKNESLIYYNKTASWFDDVHGAWGEFVKECRSAKSSFLIEAAHEGNVPSGNLHLDMLHCNGNICIICHDLLYMHTSHSLFSIRSYFL